MSTLSHRIVFGVLLALLPGVYGAQLGIESKRVSNISNMTLLTGPDLLSPPGPRFLTENGWVSVKADTPAAAEKTAAALRARPMTEAEIAADAEVRAAREKFEAAKK